MKLYLAATAPGNEEREALKPLPIHHRLLSYFFIATKGLECHTVFERIKNNNRLCNRQLKELN
jgi:hypothetical protein